MSDENGISVRRAYVHRTISKAGEISPGDCRYIVDLNATFNDSDPLNRPLRGDKHGKVRVTMP